MSPATDRVEARDRAAMAYITAHPGSTQRGGAKGTALLYSAREAAP